MKFGPVGICRIPDDEKVDHEILGGFAATTASSEVQPMCCNT